MEIRRWLYCVVNCVLVCYIVAKPFSLNKLIESESDQKGVHTTTSPEIEESEPAAERFSLNKGLKPLNRISKKFKETGTKLNQIPLGKKISPLKYRKTFQIKSPLKPKRVKNSLRTRHKRKNQSIKREIDSNAVLNKKYVPLLKSLGMLFDNILGTESRESFENTKHKKRLRYYPDEDDDVSCKCPRQRESDSVPKSEEETVTFSAAVAPEAAIITEIAAETTDNPSASNFRSFRQYKNVPLLLPRNTSGAWRNYHGLSERSRAAHNGSAERYISGNNGDSEHNSERGQEQSNAESDEEHTDSDSRNNASGVQNRGGTTRGREYRNNTQVNENDAISQDETEKYMESREDTTQYNGAYKFEAERDEAKSGKLLSEPVRREKGISSSDKIIDFTESLQSKDNYKESIIGIAHDSSSGQRLSDGDGSHSSKNKKVDSRTETLTYKLPKVENRYSAKADKTTKLKSLISNFAASGQDDDYGESDENISYDNTERKLDTDYSNLTENGETNTRSETEPHKEPIEHLRNVSKKIKDKTFVENSAEDVHAEYKKENVTLGHGSFGDEFGENSPNFLIKQTIAKPHSLDESIEAKNTQYLSKPKLSSKGPLVMILDGYSVTRHKNGENKLAEKTIRIRP